MDNIKDRITPEAVASLKRTGVGIKGQFKTGIGRGSLPSINMELRKTLNLYANIVSAVSVPGVCVLCCCPCSCLLTVLAPSGLPCRHENVDIVMIRENTEGEYSGIEHEVVPGVTESLKVGFMPVKACFEELQGITGFCVARL